MTAAQLKKLLDANALTQVGVARELEIDERQFRRYCSGEHVIPKKVEYAVRWLIHIKPR